MIQFLFYLIFSLSLFSYEHPLLIQKAALLYQKEKVNLKNYKSNLETITTVRDSTGKMIEKRVQQNYFNSPSEYIFVTKEIEINGNKQLLNKDIVERTSKVELEWLSREGLDFHQFQLIRTEGKIEIYLVQPQIIKQNIYRGQIWIDSNSNKIVKIIKEPILKKKDIYRYTIELKFDKEFQVQLPSYTKLVANYLTSNGNTEIEVEVNYKSYLLNTTPFKE
jgi:hypothetical protein